MDIIACLTIRPCCEAFPFLAYRSLTDYTSYTQQTELRFLSVTSGIGDVLLLIYYVPKKDASSSKPTCVQICLRLSIEAYTYLDTTILYTRLVRMYPGISESLQLLKFVYYT